MKYPFVGFCDAIYYGEGDDASDSENEIDGYKRHKKFGEHEYEIRDRCAACHRAEFANVSEMYLAGEGYDSNGVSGDTSKYGHIVISCIRSFIRC